MPTTLKRMLVPVDFSDPSRAALALATDLASALGASVDVLHVIDLPGPAPFASEGYVPVPDEYRARVELDVKSRLTAWLRSPGGTIPLSEHVVQGKPSIEIVRYARAHHSDLIVMGVQGGGKVPHWLMGRVAERVARSAPCPVVTVRGRQSGPEATSFKE